VLRNNRRNPIHLGWPNQTKYYPGFLASTCTTLLVVFLVVCEFISLNFFFCLGFCYKLLHVYIYILFFFNMDVWDSLSVL